MRQGTSTAVATGRKFACSNLHRSKSALVRDLAASIQCVLVPLAIIIFATGLFNNDLNVGLVGVVLLFTGNLLYGFLRMRERLLYLFLHAGIFLFLLTRPIIGSLDPDRSWFLSSYETTWFALGSIFVSLLFLLLGAVAYSSVVAFNERRRAERDAIREGISVVEVSDDVCGRSADGYVGSVEPAKTTVVCNLVDKIQQSDRLRYIRTASLILFLVGYAAAMVEGLIKLSYMDGLAYEQYYLINPDEHVPWIIGLLRPMMLYALCSYLACLPRRKPTVICLLLYITTTLPMLIIGSRADFVIAFLFAALYFVFRAITDKRERWISKRLIIAVCILAPLGIFAMGAMNYTRAGSTINGFGFTSLVFDALFKQGVSFTVLGHGYDVNGQIQELGFRCFSLGDFISTFTQGFIGQTFFDFPLLGDYNNVNLALNGNSYAHTMSYFAHPNYLGGEGYGSSYILELFADFGMAGICVGSFVLGAAFSFLSSMIGRHWFGGMVALVASMNIFHMPRGYFAEWISFIIQTRFILALVCIMGLSAIFAYASHVGLKPVRLPGFFSDTVSTFSHHDESPESHVVGAVVPTAERMAKGSVEVVSSLPLSAVRRIPTGGVRDGCTNRHSVWVNEKSLIRK